MFARKKEKEELMLGRRYFLAALAAVIVLSGVSVRYVEAADEGTAWVETAKLLASDGAADDLFGLSASVSGDTALVGALQDDDNGTDSGSAYVFVRSGGVWTQQAKLLASDGAAEDFFGFSVSVSGDTALVGAGLDDDNGTSSGSAYVFEDASIFFDGFESGDTSAWSSQVPPP